MLSRRSNHIGPTEDDGGSAGNCLGIFVMKLAGLEDRRAPSPVENPLLWKGCSIQALAAERVRRYIPSFQQQ